MDVKELDRVKESSPAIIAVTSSSSPSLFLNTTSNKNDNDEEDVCQDQLDDSSSSPSNDVISALNVEVDTKELIPTAKKAIAINEDIHNDDVNNEEFDFSALRAKLAQKAESTTTKKLNIVVTLDDHYKSQREKKLLELKKKNEAKEYLKSFQCIANNANTCEGQQEVAVADADADADANAGSKKDASKSEKDGWTEYQESILLQMLAAELDMASSNILDFELNLFDVQKASLGGAYSEFVHSARLDNLASCFMAVEGLVEYSSKEGALECDEDISLVALFDHEEIGSDSATGAGSPIMGEAVKRICSAFEDKDDSHNHICTYSKSIAKSFVLSVDQAHAIHPNYAGKHEKGHAPKMNDGMVIKRNSNQRYATTGVTGLIVREIARKAGLKPVQEFVVRNDCGCGSTIGPIISSTTGMRAIDMGCPQLSMHSIRETMGTSDFTNGLDLFKAFFLHFRDVDDSIADKN
mmetsp:Transcript_6935/g.10400  ORF Transcript_6935/g.10400 Transcript_6935/m.10400 type:complete len:467 (-) Transcript_6935:68-1468(-)